MTRAHGPYSPYSPYRPLTLTATPAAYTLPPPSPKHTDQRLMQEIPARWIPRPGRQLFQSLES